MRQATSLIITRHVIHTHEDGWQEYCKLEQKMNDGLVTLGDFKDRNTLDLFIAKHFFEKA